MSLKSINRSVDSVKLLIIVFIVFALVSLIICCVSEEPAKAISSFFLGPFTSIRRIGNIIEGAIPLIFTALAVTLIFKTGLFSMISEGSFFIGILGAMIIGIAVPLPSALHPMVALLVSALFGAVVASVPAMLKLLWNVSEVVTSIMFNYVVQFFVIYVVSYYFREPDASSLASLKIQTSASLPTIVNGTRVHFGLILALVLCLFLWFLLSKTKIGFKIRVVGENRFFSRYVGINAPVVMVVAQLVAGAIAGFGGGVEFLGLYTRFKWTSTPGYGWTGIAVALLARRNPLMIPFAALFMSYLETGSAIMARSSDVSSEIVLIIQGVIMLFIAAEAFLGKWKQSLIVKSAERGEM